MNEQFLKMLENNLDDSTTWLAYADWLEEQGDFKGELLRIRQTLYNCEDFPELLIKRFHQLLTCPNNSTHYFWKFNFGTYNTDLMFLDLSRNNKDIYNIMIKEYKMLQKLRKFTYPNIYFSNFNDLISNLIKYCNRYLVDLIAFIDPNSQFSFIRHKWTCGSSNNSKNYELFKINKYILRNTFSFSFDIDRCNFNDEDLNIVDMFAIKEDFHDVENQIIPIIHVNK